MLSASITLSDTSQLYRWGCTAPLRNAKLCWEVSTETEKRYPPHERIHLLPLSWYRGEEEQVLVKQTRSLYQQMLGSGVGHPLILEWSPVFSLEEAVRLVRQRGWPSLLWLSPRVLRNSSAATQGVVDLQGYLIDGDRGQVQPVRTVRVRVESDPQRKLDFETILATMGVMRTVRALADMSLTGVLTVVAPAALQSRAPPTAGHSLELLTELAIRQIVLLFRHAPETIRQVQQPISE